jgi:hypothetical protein
MKVGDLVKVKALTGPLAVDGKVGVITKLFKNWESPVWEVVFGTCVELMFEGGLELVNESR